MKVNTTKVFSILLAISWFIVLFFLLYPFLKYNTPPNFWLLLILAVLPLFMLIQKLKIGSFFDFSKSDSPPHQTTTTIGQQINLPVMGKDFTEAITEFISKSLEDRKKQLSSSSQNKHYQYNKLNHSIDLILMNSLPTITAFYSITIATIKDDLSSMPDDNFKEPVIMQATIPLFPEKKINYSSLLPLIKIIQANLKSVFSDYAEEISLNLSNIQKLIELRTSTPTTPDESEFSKETFFILFKASESAIFLSSFMAGHWSEGRVFMKSLSSRRSKPINKSGNKETC